MLSPMTPQSPELAHARELARSQQNLVGAAVAGSVVALLCAIGWAMLTFATHRQFGLVAVALGYAVGLTVRSVGHGFEAAFAYLGGFLAFLGCATGNLLTGCAVLAQAEGVGVMQVIGSLDFATVQRVMTAMADPMDLLFYGIAVWEGFRLSRVPPPTAAPAPAPTA
jgi:hypothetical protein